MLLLKGERRKSVVCDAILKGNKNAVCYQSTLKIKRINLFLNNNQKVNISLFGFLKEHKNKFKFTLNASSLLNNNRFHYDLNSNYYCDDENLSGYNHLRYSFHDKNHNNKHYHDNELLSGYNRLPYIPH